MRRTGSSSCLLKPKKSLSQHDLALLHDKAPTATVLTVNRLPPYVTDRLYMLSELQVHSHSIQFLCDLKKNGTKPSLPASIILYLRWKPNTYPTPLSFADGPLSECVRQCLLANGDDAPFDELQLVRSRPREIPYSPRRQHNEELPDHTVQSLKKRSIPLPLLDPTALSVSKSTDAIETQDDEENEDTQLTNIYVVVDRISPESNGDDIPDLPDLTCTSYESIQRGEQSEYSSQTSSTNTQQSQRQPQSEEQRELEQLKQHNNEMKVVKSLARAIASSRFLRNRIDGVTIGLASDSRAAPGLEGCMNTVARGAKERRRASISKQIGSEEGSGRREAMLNRLREKSPERSPIAIVACELDDLESDHEHSHHHHHHHDADTSNKILQSRIITEWNGKGDCESFVDRAMSDWRQAWSVSSVDEKGIASNGVYHGKTRPKVPRISRKEVETEYEEESDIDEPVSTIMIIVLLGGILAYMWNLYGDDIHSLLTGDS
ncbi:hypothetical protein ACHAWT_008259 [Skeletonema menzelii]